MDPEPLSEQSRLSVWPKVVVAAVILLGVSGILAAFLFAPSSRGKEPAQADQSIAEKNPLDEIASYTPPEDSGYVGSARCAECHGAIAQSFKSHPMANSASLISAATVGSEQLQQTRVVGKQRVLDVELRDDELVHHERMFDSEGKLIYDQAVPMTYSVGSGRRAKAYVHQRGDALFMSPLNWYSQASKWDLAPNYQPDDERRFDRRVNDECLGCHTGRLNPLGRSLNRYQSPIFHELTLGCERCHGPGERHIEFRESKSTGEDPIVNPAKLDHTRRESVCNQCHLQVAVRSTRYGRSPLDFRPGQNLEEIWALLDTHLGVAVDGRTRSVNHVQQMRESRCFTQSAGKLGCTSCHDPHSVPAPNERAAFYRQRCVKCHQEGACSAPLEQRQLQQNSCIACHLPTRDSKNISHVTQTDHRVLRKPDQPTTTRTEPDQEELTLMETPELRLPNWERERALALGAWIYLSKADRQPPVLLARPLIQVLEKVPDDADTLLALGSIATQHKLMDRIRESYERGRKLPAAEEESLQGLLPLYYETGDMERGLKCADRLLQIDPGNAKVLALRADILVKLGRPEEGIQSALRALESNPTLTPVREWLIEAYRATGQDAPRHVQEELLRRMREARPPS